MKRYAAAAGSFIWRWLPVIVPVFGGTIPNMIAENWAAAGWAGLAGLSGFLMIEWKDVAIKWRDLATDMQDTMRRKQRRL